MEGNEKKGKQLFTKDRQPPGSNKSLGRKISKLKKLRDHAITMAFMDELESFRADDETGEKRTVLSAITKRMVNIALDVNVGAANSIKAVELILSAVGGKFNVAEFPAEVQDSMSALEDKMDALLKLEEGKNIENE